MHPPAERLLNNIFGFPKLPAIPRPCDMNHDPLDRTKGPSLWVFIAGFAAAALLTLAAAVGTSMLNGQAAGSSGPGATPVVQK